MSTPDEPNRPADSDRRPEVRIGDREREQAVAHLGRAFGEGRLELAEYDERVASAYAAKTASDLLLLTADLPVATRQSGSASTNQAAGPESRIRYASNDPEPEGPGWIWRLWATYASVVTLSVVIWLIVGLTGKGGFSSPWPLWVAGPWGALLLFQTIGAATGRRHSGGAQH